MAGVVAMASVIEDFDTQPCKKSRKDGSSSVVKTITNYFSPVPKPVEKPFSPPRSNNIMDYFSRKAPPSKEKTSPPQQPKENDQKSQSAEKQTRSEMRKQTSEKRKKSCKAAKKLVAEIVNLTDEASCMIVEGTDDNSAVEAVSSTLGRDTAVQLSKLSAVAYESDISDLADAKSVSEEQNEEDSPPDCGSKCENNVKQETEPNTTELSTTVPSRVKIKQVKTAARNARKRQQKETKSPQTEKKEAEGSLCDDSMEVNMDEASQLNISTVTISFEDFVRSQNKVEEGLKDDKAKDCDGESSTEVEESKHLDVTKCKGGVSPVVPSAQISPRTVTIQAEVHEVSPKQEAAKAVGKVASIFKKKNASNSPAEIVSSPHIKEHHSPTLSSTTKQKSNVVLQEEDLELAVIESESTPKCSEAERKQFMAAFKQPSLDGAKTKPVKSQGKPKPAEEEAADNTTEEEFVTVPSDDDQGSQNNKAAKRKPTKRGRSKAKNVKEAASPAGSAAEETPVIIIEAEDKKEEPPVSSSPSAPALRRSRREAVLRQTPETTKTSPVKKTRSQKESKEDVAAVLPEDSPVNMSTAKRRRSKHGVFVAQMVSPPNAKESPIRIKFSRVHKNSTSKAESGSNKTSTSKTLNESNKRKQAKELVEKAKRIQQSKKMCVEKDAIRRSSRVKTSIQRSYCEDEDSLICVEDLTSTPQGSPGKSKTQKPLRSLNDVLGKVKDTKTVAGSKVASLSQETCSRRASAVVSIFDESSHEGSENSQDDEQFRARREFLKSGLPESFRKQIAKVAATKEAYSVSSSSFQTVTHTTQPPDDCRLWSLPWPESSLLSHLKETWSRTLNRPPAVGGSLCVKTVPAYRVVYEKGSGWRPEFSESIRQLLVEELKISNSDFPAQIFFSRFLRRRAEHQRQFTASEPEAVAKDKTCTPQSAKSVGRKRKRTEDERESMMKMAEKEKSNHSVQNIATADPPRRGKRSLRSREKKEEELKEKLRPAPVPSEDDCVLIVDDQILEEDIGKKDVVKEDLLWTDKYQPQLSSDIVDNVAAVKRLQSWLKEWKLRTDREERKNQKDKKREEDGSDSDWGDEDSQEMEDMLCNTVLITGPTGVGKTAAVYACAQELGFKVFEVNASSQRSGRLILSQLKEATQSHQVDSQGVSAYKPAYFSSYGANGSSSSVKPGNCSRKVKSPRTVVSSPRKTPQSPRSAKKGGLAPTSLAKFFKMAQPTYTEPPTTTGKEEKAPLKKAIKGNENGDKTNNVTMKSPAAGSTKEKTSKEQNKAATSLILFEEVDVIFEDDSGFLAAIKTFMSTTKRPVILTTSDPAFSKMFDGSFEEINFKTPSHLNVGSYLQLLCLAEDVRTSPADVGSLLRLNACDIRQSLLQLQFWTRSAGGCRSSRPLAHAAQNETEEAADDSCVLPPCDTGCTESKLGLLNVEPHKNIWELLRSQSLMEEAVCWELLTDSRRRGVDLLYSNMETLLPLPLTQLATSRLSKPVPQTSFSQDNQSVVPTQQPIDSSDDSSPVKVSNRMKRNKKRRHLSDRDELHSESDSEDGFPSLCKPRNDPQKEEVEASGDSETVKRKVLTVEDRRKSLPVSQCLESLADFWDNMSYVDSSLPFHQTAHAGTPPASAVIKDGMSDESRVETCRGSRLTGGRVLEIQAAVEALSFQKCRTSVIEAWDKVQLLTGELGKEAAAELTLPVAAHREGCSFTQDALCHPQLVQRRKEAMENQTFQMFDTLGNREAFALDYLPTMRTICRSEQLKEQGKVKRRFLHYLDVIHLGLEKSTLQLLAEDFP
ncbi:ATPase family AAA domain-containing protein 5 [Nematolebias whitei]|uniref:ATPase family AAA domain-containing protein 5 n=1 Tax=Nematolebias whitei TaxID=451745 RepID=UPI001899D4C1|nr:ATPase family AAA domain-containing protein 5 [Nematolebias whitei]